MTILLIAAAGLQMMSSRPPLAPEDAAQVLRTCACLSNRSNPPDPPGPVSVSVVITSDPASGPFGTLHLSPSRPTCCDRYVGPWPVMGPWLTAPGPHPPYAGVHGLSSNAPSRAHQPDPRHRP